ncbi:hypothetical protein IWQ61_007145 [Dispira simplex]|nr:hypothetical protein IWQ61_007145 [Dispira simplex]
MVNSNKRPDDESSVVQEWVNDCQREFSQGSSEETLLPIISDCATIILDKELKKALEKTNPG